LLTQLKVEGADTLCSGAADAPTRYLRMWPHKHGTDGFFAAVWQRN
jgi:16S rRNA (cytosine967-C5)-methyltransferase